MMNEKFAMTDFEKILSSAAAKKTSDKQKQDEIRAFVDSVCKVVANQIYLAVEAPLKNRGFATSNGTKDYGWSREIRLFRNSDYSESITVTTESHSGMNESLKPEEKLFQIYYYSQYRDAKSGTKKDCIWFKRALGQSQQLSKDEMEQFLQKLAEHLF